MIASRRKTFVHRVKKLARKTCTLLATPEPEQLLVLRGLRRSGNHAISGVLRSCADVCFKNNIVQIGPYLRGCTQPPEAEEFRGWCRRAGVNERHVLVSLEDHALEFQPFREVGIPQAEIIVMRDPYNMLASRLMRAMNVEQPELYPRANDVHLQRIVRLWKTYARECLGETHILGNARCVYYNAWVRSADYRKNVVRALGLGECQDDSHLKVARVGGGSSFDGYDFDGRGANMSVFSRWEQLPDRLHELAGELARDEELRALAERMELAFGGL